MNRDALKLQTPEARVLKSICEREKPLFGFNLHDQDPRNTVGQTTKAAAIALLAPAEKESGPDSESRKRAKHLAAFLVEALKPHIPDNLARYDDTFESRAFGDNVQKWGTSTVLIESGGWANDREKMFLRKLNFVAILCSLNAILSGEYEKTDVRSYEQLPLNGKNLYDLIFHNVRFQPSNNLQPVFIDVGINFDEQKDPSSGRMVLIGKIVDLGDLSTFGAFEEKHCDGRPFGPDVLAIDKSMTREEWLFILGGS